MAIQSSLARLEACIGKADYAQWILTESDNGIAAAFPFAKVAFHACGFQDGHDALVARMAAMNSQRLPDGSLPQTVIMRLEEQKSRLREVVSRARGGV